MTKKLFIIGNGFDLHHGIQSKYSEFATYLKEQDRTVFDIAETYVVPEKDLWSYLEERLAEVDVDQIEDYANDFLVSYGDEDWSDSYHHDYEYEIEQICAAISEKMRNHFSDWVRKIKIPSHAVHPVRCIDPTSLFLNFNYTSTLQNLYDVPHDGILHIHGSAKDPTAEIILGHGWDRQTSDLRSRFADEDTDARVAGGFQLIDDLLAGTFKPTKEIIQQNKMFFQSLHSVTQVYVLGHSLACVDAPYFNEVLSNLGSNTEWIVSFHNDRAETISAAKDIGIPAPNIHVARLIDL